jgi:hypothetical protein
MLLKTSQYKISWKTVRHVCLKLFHADTHTDMRQLIGVCQKITRFKHGNKLIIITITTTTTIRSRWPRSLKHKRSYAAQNWIYNYFLYSSSVSLPLLHTPNSPENQRSLPCWQEPATGPYAEAYESSPHYHFPLLRSLQRIRPSPRLWVKVTRKVIPELN